MSDDLQNRARRGDRDDRARRSRFGNRNTVWWLPASLDRDTVKFICKMFFGIARPCGVFPFQYVLT
jgi:hypothetical protein